jgi:hypothetical protein
MGEKPMGIESCEVNWEAPVTIQQLATGKVNEVHHGLVHTASLASAIHAVLSLPLERAMHMEILIDRDVVGDRTSLDLQDIQDLAGRADFPGRTENQ